MYIGDLRSVRDFWFGFDIFFINLMFYVYDYFLVLLNVYRLLTDRLYRVKVINFFR